MPRPADDPHAELGRLYDRYGASLYRYAAMILADPAGAEDALHQVFAALIAAPRSLENEEHYLRRAVRNECYSFLRRQSRAAAAGPLLEAAEASGSPVSNDERLALETAIRELPPEQREVLHLHVFEGRTFQEIADACGESINTVASRYRYALAKLRQMLTS